MQLDSEKKRTRQLEDQVTQLQKEIAQLGEGLQQGKSMLDEKTSVLSLARKQLRNTRERNSVCVICVRSGDMIYREFPTGTGEDVRKDEHYHRQAASS